MFFEDENLEKNKYSRRKPYKEPFVRKKLNYIKPTVLPCVEYTDRELYDARGATLVFDVETYPNYFLVSFKCPTTLRVTYFEFSEELGLYFNEQKLNFVIHNFKLVGFNSKNYDEAVMFMALYGHSNRTLKTISDLLVSRDVRYTKTNVEADYNVQFPHFDHIDLFQLVPLKPSLKMLGARLHSKRLQELPYDPAHNLTLEQAVEVRYYNFNDLDLTIELWIEMQEQVELRVALSQDYGQDLRSRSDAQIAEHVLSSECEKINGYWARRPVIATGTVFYYEPPPFICFQTPMMNEVFRRITQTPFVINDKGRPTSEYLRGLKIKIADGLYTMGVGGLHSNEKSVTHKADENFELIDIDVESFYPWIILNNGFYPKHLGKAFLVVYRAIVDRRLDAKKLSKHEDEEIAKMNKIISDSLKITINGSFGKLGSKWSSLYSPDLLVQVTLTGQLSLLMLIEALELENINVISANTDGIVTKPHKTMVPRLREIVGNWERHTCFKMEETHYKAVLSRDVNNYIALKKHFDSKTKEWVDEFPAGTKLAKKYKGKGVFGETSIKKQPMNEICSTAIATWLIEQVPIAETIGSCRNLNDFLTVKKITGGGEKDGVYVGKTVRWYYAQEERGDIKTVLHGGRVGGSLGAWPVLDLPETFPANLDKDWYVNASEQMLAEMGFYGRKRSTLDGLFFEESEAEKKKDSW